MRQAEIDSANVQEFHTSIKVEKADFGIEINKSKILIVDDTKTNIDILIQALGEEFKLAVALDGLKALEYLNNNPVDLILLDIMMPGIDGFEVCQKLKKNPATRDIPIIFITANDSIGGMTKGFKVGGVDYITKPFDTLEVKTRVETHLNLKFAKEALKDQNIILEEKVRKRTKALQESEKRYRILIEAADRTGQAVIIIQDRNGLEGVGVFSNETAVKITGYSHEEFSAVSWLDIVHPRDRSVAKQRAIKRMQGEDIPDLLEISIVKKDGTEISIETSSIRSEFQGEIALVTFFRDITERMQAGKERKKLINELQVALDEVKTLSDISETVNQSLDLEKVLNDALDRIMELFRPHSAHIRLLDNKTQELVLAAQKGLRPEDLEKLEKRLKLGEAIFRHAIKSHKAIVIENILTDPRTAGTQSFCEEIGCRTFVAIPLYSKGKLLGHMSIRGREPSAFTTDEIQLFTSIGHQVGTAIENAELYRDMEVTIKELNETQDQLRQSQKMESIGTLAGGIAHDFNNILTPVICYTEMAMGDIDKGSVLHGNLEEVYKAGMRARDLVRQILAFSRQSEEELIPIQVSLIVKEALKLLRASLPSTINIRPDIETDLPAVLADPTQIHQVVMNLCTNAAHAMKDKGGALKISLSQVKLDSDDRGPFVDISPGHYLKLAVSDTGYGISPDNIRQIFDPYFTTKEKGEGTGLGLSVVHGIVKSIGGDIAVESAPGKGTTLTVYIPAIQRIPSPDETEEPEALPTGSERILFIDDEPAIADIGKKILESLGYDVELRTSSIEALELFRVHPERFDLIVTDMTMPQMRGDKMAEELMKIQPDIPVILCSGFSKMSSEERAKSLRIKDFVMKPFVIRDLAVTVRKVLDNGPERIPE